MTVPGTASPPPDSGLREEYRALANLMEHVVADSKDGNIPPLYIGHAHLCIDALRLAASLPAPADEGGELDEIADYLDALENELIGIDADLKVNAGSPGIKADLLRDIAKRLRGRPAPKGEGRELTPRPLDEWHEDIGPVLWWKFPVEEAPYVGTPLDLPAQADLTLGGTRLSRVNLPLTGWPGYHTHWTPIALPAPSGGKP